MASSTRLLIRQTAAGRMAGLTAGAITASVTAPVSTATDTDLLRDDGASDDAYIGSWFMFTAGFNAGTERRVQSYVPGTGTLVLGAPLALNAGNGDAYELHDHLSPSEWNRCINAALRRCTRKREEIVPIVDNQRQYALGAAIDLTRDRQVLGLTRQYGPAGQKFRETIPRVYGWDIWEDDDALTMDLKQPLLANVGINLELVLAYIAPYAALASDAATTTCDLDWVVTGTLLQALETYPNRLEEPAKKILKATVKDFQAEFRRLCMIHAPDRSREIGARLA